VSAAVLTVGDGCSWIAQSTVITCSASSAGLGSASALGRFPNRVSLDMPTSGLSLFADLSERS